MRRNDILKPPRHSVEAEQCVLGSILLDTDQLGKVRGILKSEYFYLIKHREIWDVLMELKDEGNVIDMVTVVDALKQKGKLDVAGGPAYLSSCVHEVPTPENAVKYAEIVKKKWLCKERFRMGMVICGMSQSEESDDDDFLKKTAEEMRGNLALGQENHAAGMGEACDEFLSRVRDRKDRMGLVGKSSGIEGLDRALGGFENGLLYVLGARPSKGKTSLAMNIGDFVAERYECGVVVFSLEMAKVQLLERAVCGRLEIDNDRLRGGDITEVEEARIREVVAKIKGAGNLIIDDKPSMDFGEIEARAEMYADSRKVGMVVIDYLQRQSIPGKYKDNKASCFTDAANSAKTIARKLNVPVLLLSQLNRSCEKRDNKRPAMPDLKESGGIEEAADVVMFLYRPWLYYPKAYPKEYVECLVRKHRFASVGGCALNFRGEHYKFSDWKGAIPQDNDAKGKAASQEAYKKQGCEEEDDW